jgi:lipoprotein-anchoring transpeptidase ErfK/SrfK
MTHVGSGGAAREGVDVLKRMGTVGAVAVAVVLVATACSSKQDEARSQPSTASSSASVSSSAASSASSAPPSSAVAPAALRFTPASGANAVNPVAPVSVAVQAGTLVSVRLTNADDRAVSGAMAADKASWTTTEVLGYGKTYTFTASATSADGNAVTKSGQFTTLTPSNMTMPSITTTGNSPMQDGAKYGVGIVPVVHFDEEIQDKAAAEKALKVTTSPHVTGSWYWTDDQTVHFRPQSFWTPGTHVTVAANVYGVQVGPGLYGQSDAAVSFRVGQKQTAVADDATHTVSVYFNNKLQRVMPTSMGMGGSIVVKGQTISFWTQNGTYTVIGKDNPVIMDSSTYGLPVNSKLGYKEPIYLATRISTDGVFLHELDATVWAQGNRDVSHGCLNLNRDNALWYYTTSQIGDPVTVKHSGGTPLQVWQNGDWSVPWATWVAGSALH